MTHHVDAYIELQYQSPNHDKSSMLVNRSPMNAQQGKFLCEPIEEILPEHKNERFRN